MIHRQAAAIFLIVGILISIHPRLFGASYATMAAVVTQSQQNYVEGATGCASAPATPTKANPKRVPLSGGHRGELADVNQSPYKSPARKGSIASNIA